MDSQGHRPWEDALTRIKRCRSFGILPRESQKAVRRRQPDRRTGPTGPCESLLAYFERWPTGLSPYLRSRRGPRRADGQGAVRRGARAIAKPGPRALASNNSPRENSNATGLSPKVTNRPTNLLSTSKGVFRKNTALSSQSRQPEAA